MTMGRASPTRKCNECGQPFVPTAPHHWRCPDCQRRYQDGEVAGGPGGRAERADGRPPVPAAGLPADYLRNGYFDEKGNLWPSLLLADAYEVAVRLGADRRLAATQLRRFFNKVRLIERKLDASRDFAATVAEIASLSHLAAYAVGRQTAPEAFKQFIDRNVELGTRDEKSFRRGLLPHFESVICYFKYRYPRQ